MATLHEMESLKAIIENQNEEISKLKESLSELSLIVHKMNDNEKKKVINKSLVSKEDNNDLSIILSKYKKSVLVKNKYADKNTTVKCKEYLKEMGAKWQNVEKGWLFVGVFKDEESSLEDVSKFIVDKLQEHNFNLEVEYITI